MTDFLRLLDTRRVLHQCTDAAGLQAQFGRGMVTGYIGFDLTAPSLHVGSLIQIMTLRRLQQAGGRPIVLLGGGTTKIGDPSGRDESRQLLDEAAIAANKARIRAIFGRYLSFEGPSGALMVDNADWLEGLQMIAFLRDVGRHFSVNAMIKMDSVRLRLEREQSLSFLEFNYMVMQAYDFVELRRRYGCVLQMGGSDQWGNIVSGIDLGRRMDNADLFGVTSPLLTTASGAKMGKTASGAVWLDADMLSPYEFWQYWRNTEDADVGRFLRIFTELPDDEIARLEALGGAEINSAKKILATEVTALAHGREAAQAAAETARRTFEEGTAAAGLKRVEITRETSVVDAAVLAGLVKSKSEARRLIENRGLYLNDMPVSDPATAISAAAPLVAPAGPVREWKLSAGKKAHVVLTLAH